VTKWLKIDEDNLHMKFLALNADFSSLRLYFACLKRPAQASIKDCYHVKSGYFTATSSFSVKTVADRHRYTAHHNKRWWRSINGVNNDDLEWP